MKKSLLAFALLFSTVLIMPMVRKNALNASRLATAALSQRKFGDLVPGLVESVQYAYPALFVLNFGIIAKHFDTRTKAKHFDIPNDDKIKTVSFGATTYDMDFNPNGTIKSKEHAMLSSAALIGAPTAGAIIAAPFFIAGVSSLIFDGIPLDFGIALAEGSTKMVEGSMMAGAGISTLCTTTGVRKAQLEGRTIDEIINNRKAAQSNCSFQDPTNKI